MSTDSAPRPRLLDLFCCEGGAAVGYHRAGFDVVGVDLFDAFSQKRYPFESIKADALEVLADRQFMATFDAVHASPPCQHASAGTRASKERGKYPALIEPVRDALDGVFHGPWVIENVEGSALRDPLVLCGTMFGLTTIDTDGTPLELWRHRCFESNLMLLPPVGCRHGAYSEQVAGCYGGARRDKVEAREVRGGGYVPADKGVVQRLMGIDWMTWNGMYQALPPIYTEYLGRQLLTYVAELKENAYA